MKPEPSAMTPGPIDSTPSLSVLLITDGATPNQLGSVASGIAETQIVSLAESAEIDRSGRSTIYVANTLTAGLALAASDSEHRSAGDPLLLAIPEELPPPTPEVIEGLTEYDLTAIHPRGNMLLITLEISVHRRGTSAELLSRLLAHDGTALPQPPESNQSDMPPDSETHSTRISGANSQAPTARLLGLLRRNLRYLLAAAVLTLLITTLAALTFNTLGEIALTTFGIMLLLAALGVNYLAFSKSSKAYLLSKRTLKQAKTTASRVSDLSRDIKSASALASTNTLLTQEVVSHLSKAEAAALRGMDLATSIEALKLPVSKSSTKWDLNYASQQVINETQALIQLINKYPTDAPLPPAAGWAMNPTGLLWLTNLIQTTSPNTVVECGSGTSTVWICLALKRNGGGKLVSLEHQETYAARTRQMLADHGLSEYAEVRVCELAEVVTPAGSFRWYDLDPASVGSIDLLMVDGPPSSTGVHARYPALAILSEQLTDGATVAMDDTGRRDEQEVLELWGQSHEQLSAPTEVAAGVSAMTWRSL